MSSFKNFNPLVRLSVLSGLVLSTLIQTPLMAEDKALVETSPEVIGSIRIHVKEEDAQAIIYMISQDGNWSAEKCPTAKYAFIKAKSGSSFSAGDVDIAKMVMDLAITSKTNNIPITFEGECGNANGNEEYFKIIYATL